MANLSSLPSELLEQILGYNGVSHKVLDLWKCGNARLNALLVRSCTSVVLQDTKWNSTSRFPKMLHQLRRLKSLSLRRTPSLRLMDSEQLGRELMLLSPTLEALELECFEAELCLLRPLGPVDWDFSRLPLTSVQHKQDAPTHSNIDLRLWPIQETFPLLAYLTLNASVSTLTSEDLLALPQTLTYLELRAPGRTRIQDHAKNLPRGLQALMLR